MTVLAESSNGIKLCIVVNIETQGTSVTEKHLEPTIPNYLDCVNDQMSDVQRTGFHRGQREFRSLDPRI